MATTTNLGLKLFTKNVDLDTDLEHYRLDLNGPTDSNMTILDDWAKVTLGPLLVTGLMGTPLLLSTITACLTSIDSFVDYAIPLTQSYASASAAISASFVKIGEFSGSGQADFNSISQNYTHIIILGTAAVNSGSPFMHVGCDFNGSTGSATYSSLRWNNSGSCVSASSTVFNTEVFSSSPCGQIILAQCSGSTASAFGTPFIAIVPFYSGSGGLNKTAMGTSVFIHQNSISNQWESVSKQGGCWTSNAAITRIRLFGITTNFNDNNRYNFLTGTDISLYGLK